MRNLRETDLNYIEQIRIENVEFPWRKPILEAWWDSKTNILERYLKNK